MKWGGREMKGRRLGRGILRNEEGRLGKEGNGKGSTGEERGEVEGRLGRGILRKEQGMEKEGQE